MSQKIFITLLAMLISSAIFAQIETDSLQQADVNTALDSAYIKRQAFIRDSIIAREAFVRDSIIKREAFVRDSLYKRKLILDSVSFLKSELPRLLEAAIRSENEEIIIATGGVNIIGDSSLSDFTYKLLAQDISAPYAPWRSAIKLAGRDIVIEVDTLQKVIKSIKLAKKLYDFDYQKGQRFAVIRGGRVLISKRQQNYYQYPIDSIFFNNEGRVGLIKSYFHYFEASKTYKKGKSLYIDMAKIKKFEYFPDGLLSNYQVITFCDRWSVRNANESCHKVIYSISKQGRKFTIKETNFPEHAISDGTFIYEFDDNFDLKNMEYIGADKVLNHKCFVELNEDRNVKLYLYKKDGVISRSLFIKYNKDPNAPYKYETISSQYKKDGIAYYQKNNRTKQTRTRDELTLKWSEWK